VTAFYVTTRPPPGLSYITLRGRNRRRRRVPGLVTLSR
jgi:hypothetical protein